MEWSLRFFINSLLLGVGLAMDAFSVSMANGLNEPGMGRKRMFGMAGVFAGFQALMPLLGWVCVHTVVQLFEGFTVLIPWIALGLLAYIGGKMLLEGIRHKDGGEAEAVSGGGLVLQGVATSIDALSVGFTIAEYGPLMAAVCAAIIAAVTFVKKRAEKAKDLRLLSQTSKKRSQFCCILQGKLVLICQEREKIPPCLNYAISKKITRWVQQPSMP